MNIGDVDYMTEDLQCLFCNSWSPIEEVHYLRSTAHAKDMDYRGYKRYKGKSYSLQSVRCFFPSLCMIFTNTEYINWVTCDIIDANQRKSHTLSHA